MKHLYIFFALILTSFSATAHWSTKGPYGGTVTCFAQVDTNLFVGTRTGGVYKSTNTNGTVWRYVNYTGLTNASINALTGMGSKVLAGTAGGGVFVSNDAGITWAASNTGLTGLTVQALLTATGGKIFAGTSAGIFMSADSGKTWASANTGITHNNITSLAESLGGLYAGTTGGGVFQSGNGGTSWSSVALNIGNSNVVSLAVSDSLIFAGTEAGLYFSSLVSLGWAIMPFGSSAVTALAVVGDTLYAASGSSFMRTSIVIPAWDNFDQGIPAGDTIAAITSFNGKLFAGTLHGGIRSRVTSASNIWAAANNGFNNLKTTALLCADTLLIFVATDKGVYVSRDLAASYQLGNTGLTDSLNVIGFAYVGGNLYAGTANHGMFISGSFVGTDPGASWVAANTNISDLNIVKVAGANNTILAATKTGKIYSTTANSNNWADRNTGLPANAEITALVVDAASDNWFVAIKNAGVYIYDVSTWQPLGAGLTNLDITSLAVVGTKLFVGTNGGGVFYQEIFFPVQWTAVNTGLPSLNIQSLTSTDGKYVIAGYKGGVHSTYNNGTTWAPTNVLLYIPEYSDVPLISCTAGRVFVALPDNSVYSNSKAELPQDPNAIAEVHPEVAAISVYPNPTNGAFTLSYNRAAVRVQQIAVYDITGKLVQQLPVTAVATYALSYPAGIYFLQITTDKGTAIRKVVVQ